MIDAYQLVIWKLVAIPSQTSDTTPLSPSVPWLVLFVQAYEILHAVILVLVLSTLCSRFYVNRILELVMSSECAI